jgi:hypothetical protein
VVPGRVGRTATPVGTVQVCVGDTLAPCLITVTTGSGGCDNSTRGWPVGNPRVAGGEQLEVAPPDARWPGGERSVALPDVQPEAPPVKFHEARCSAGAVRQPSPQVSGSTVAVLPIRLTAPGANACG